jgi:hypothetical protein
VTYYNPTIPPEQPRRQRKKWSRSTKTVMVILLVVLGLLCCAGGTYLATGGDQRHAAVKTVPAEPLKAPASVAPVTSSSSKPTPAKTTTKAAPAPVTIDGDNIVHVGEDVPAGTYRTESNVGADGTMCYWMKSTDSEGENIIDNDIPSGGRPQVTLKKGQWFTTRDCPTWVKK